MEGEIIVMIEIQRKVNHQDLPDGEDGINESELAQRLKDFRTRADIYKGLPIDVAYRDEDNPDLYLYKTERDGNVSEVFANGYPLFEGWLLGRGYYYLGLKKEELVELQKEIATFLLNTCKNDSGFRGIVSHTDFSFYFPDAPMYEIQDFHNLMKVIEEGDVTKRMIDYDLLIDHLLHLSPLIPEEQQYFDKMVAERPNTQEDGISVTTVHSQQLSHYRPVCPTTSFLPAYGYFEAVPLSKPDSKGNYLYVGISSSGNRVLHTAQGGYDEIPGYTIMVIDSALNARYKLAELLARRGIHIKMHDVYAPAGTILTKGLGTLSSGIAYEPGDDFYRELPEYGRESNLEDMDRVFAHAHEVVHPYDVLERRNRNAPSA